MHPVPGTSTQPKKHKRESSSTVNPPMMNVPVSSGIFNPTPMQPNGMQTFPAQFNQQQPAPGVSQQQFGDLCNMMNMLAQQVQSLALQQAQQTQPTQETEQRRKKKRSKLDRDGFSIRSLNSKSKKERLAELEEIERQKKLRRRRIQQEKSDRDEERPKKRKSLVDRDEDVPEKSKKPESSNKKSLTPVIFENRYAGNTKTSYHAVVVNPLLIVLGFDRSRGLDNQYEPPETPRSGENAEPMTIRVGEKSYPVAYNKMHFSHQNYDYIILLRLDSVTEEDT